MKTLNEEYTSLAESKKFNEEEYFIKQKTDLEFTQIFLGVDKYKNRSIMFSFSNPLSKADMDRLPKWTGLSILNQKLVNTNNNKEEWFLIFSEEKINHELNIKVFIYLIEDILKGIQTIKNSDLMLNHLKTTLSKWEQFFYINKSKPFSNIQLQGIYGELQFLKKLLESSSQDLQLSILDGWNGLSNAKRDYKYGEDLFEVKTSSQNKPYSVSISSEEQLFVSEGKQVYLCSYMLSKDNQLGSDLKTLILEIENILLSDNCSVFKEKLFQAGLIMEMLEDQELEKFIVQENLNYKVKSGFPILNKKNMPKEIFNVKYSIALEGLENYLIDIEEIVEEVKKYLI